jgi:hypothetical protein
MTGDFEHFSQGGQGSETPRKSKTFISTYMEDFPMANYITPERERETAIPSTDLVLGVHSFILGC